MQACSGHCLLFIFSVDADTGPFYIEMDQRRCLTFPLDRRRCLLFSVGADALYLRSIGGGMT
jgi:hypothetical protein